MSTVAFDPRPHWTVAKVYPHHKARNVKLTPKASVRFKIGCNSPKVVDQALLAGKPHHETAEQAASRVLARMLTRRQLAA